MTDKVESKCPVMHGAMTTHSSSGTSNKDWWPNQLNLNILHQHDVKSVSYTHLTLPTSDLV